MTIEQYVENLKELVPAHFVENTKDWSTSDKMYVFLHYIQLKKMEEIKEIVGFSNLERFHEYSKYSWHEYSNEDNK